MNNERRNNIKLATRKIEEIKEYIEDILSDEENSYDNMPEGLKSTMNGMNSEDSIDSLNNAVEYLENAIDSLEDIM